jgi:hypothetical protein
LSMTFWVKAGLYRDEEVSCVIVQGVSMVMIVFRYFEDV